jgi:WD40 repeat protein
VQLNRASHARWIEAHRGHPDRGSWFIAASPSGRSMATVASVMGDSVVHLWDVARWEVVARISPAQDLPCVRTMSWSADDALLALDSDELFIYEASTGQQLVRDAALRGPLAWVPGTTTLLAFAQDGELVSLDVSSPSSPVRRLGAPPITTGSHKNHREPRSGLSVRCSPDGSEYAVTGRVYGPGGLECATALWTERGGWQLLEGQAALSWTPSGQRRLVCPSRRELWLERTRRGPLVRYQSVPLRPHPAFGPGALPPFEQIAWNPSGERLALAQPTGEVFIVEAATGSVVARVGQATSWRSSLTWVGEHHVAVAPELSVWDTRVSEENRIEDPTKERTHKHAWAREAPTRSVPAPQGLQVLAVRREPALQGLVLQGDVLAVVTEGRVHRVDLDASRAMPPLPCRRTGPFAASGGTLAFCTPDHGVELVSLSSAEPARRLGRHEDVLDDLSWSPLGTHLASSSWDGTMRLWDVGSGREAFRATSTAWVGSREAAPRVLFSPAGSRLAFSTTDEELLGVRVVTMDGYAVRALGRDACSIGPWVGETRLLCRSHADGLESRVTLWDVVRGETLSHCVYPSSFWTGACPRGSWVVLAGFQGLELALWKPERGPAVDLLRFDEPLLDAPRVLDHELVLTHHQGGTLRAWDAVEQRVRFSVPGAVAYALSPCRTWIAVATADEVLWLHGSDGTVAARHPLPPGERVRSLRCARGGQVVVTEHPRGSVLCERDGGARVVIKPAEEGFLGRTAEGNLYLHGGGSLVEVTGSGSFSRLTPCGAGTADPIPFVRALPRTAGVILPITTL